MFGSTLSIPCSSSALEVLTGQRPFDAASLPFESSNEQGNRAPVGTNHHPDIAAGRLEQATYGDNFADIRPPLAPAAAPVEAARCYFCYDAPCITACPTGIDIPTFIRKIRTGNRRGAALTILEENIFGGVCARVCPTEVLCEQDCVRTDQEGKPVAIGLLQRFATDGLMDVGAHPFTRPQATGRQVAVVGAGPAGLSCAHALARRGHDVVVFDGRDKAGGLNEYGIAAYKVVDDFAQAEVDFIAAIGGIELRFGQVLGTNLALEDLRRDHDAVFLGLGQGGVRAMALDGEDLGGVLTAVEAIADLRQAADLSTLPVGRRIVVIGGGNTAIDIAVQSKRLGADEVTIAYRRGLEHMGATWHEREFAQSNGVKITYWAKPIALDGADGWISHAVFERTQLDGDGRLQGTGETFEIPCDTLFKAIGQELDAETLAGGPEVAGGRIVVDTEMRTSLGDVWAGGDCVAGADLTVQAVQDGKLAAAAIDRHLAQT